MRERTRPATTNEANAGRAETAGFRVGVRYRVEEDDVRAILKTRQWRGLVPRRDTVHGVFDRHDPAPSLESLRKLVRL